MGAGSSAHLGLCPHLCLALSPWLVLWMTSDLKITWMVWLHSFVHPDVLAWSSISLFLLVVLYRPVFSDLVVKSHLDLLLLHRSLFASKSVQEIHFGSSPREQMQKFHLYAVGSLLSCTVVPESELVDIFQCFPKMWCWSEVWDAFWFFCYLSAYSSLQPSRVRVRDPSL